MAKQLTKKPMSETEKKSRIKKLWERFRGKKEEKNEDIAKGMSGVNAKQARNLSEDDAEEIRKLMRRKK